tara:strand:- start:5338 stop:6696 length:1359 start_codon:yes stop_codon:yes gene_type:complete
VIAAQLDRSDLRPYQERIATMIRERESLLLNVPMGLGKTVTVLTAVADLVRLDPKLRVLIIAPKRVATDVWPNEAALWSHMGDMTMGLIRGGWKQRTVFLQSQRCNIEVINFELVSWLQTNFPDRHYDMIVVDESSRLRSGKKRTSVAKRLSTFGAVALICARTARRVLMTGTMTPNGVQNLWPQLYCLDGGERLCRTRTAFERKWFQTDYMGWNMKLLPGAEEEIIAASSDLIVTLAQEDFVKLPPSVPVKHFVEMVPAVRADYREMQRTLVSMKHDVAATTRASCRNKLLQLCNGAMYREDGEVVDVHKDKIEVLEELARSTDDNLLVLYRFKFDLRAIRTAFDYARALDNTAVRDWSAGKIRMLVAHPASMAHGLNLQHGGHRVVWFGLTDSLELYQQSNARLARPGQKGEHCYVHHIITRGTVEERVLSLLGERGVTQDRITDAFTEG